MFQQSVKCYIVMCPGFRDENKGFWIGFTDTALQSSELQEIIALSPFYALSSSPLHAR
jgi:hypothetical protein